ncbi:MAG: pentapeptide repeat-containing protein [Acidobacteriota bacterium]|nr:pentapeptide repeat-containing protein [Acidobacteriota bacterium]
MAILLPAAIAALALIIYVPHWQAKRVQHLDEKERFDRENEARKTIIQLIGGLAVLVTLYGTTETLRIGQQQLRVAVQSQVTDRFTKAIEQLGSTDTSGRPKLELRIGSIYALARISTDSPEDAGPIREILCAYVRQHATVPQVNDSDDPDSMPSPSPEIQSILNVLGRLSPVDSSSPRPDLSNSNLAGLSMAHGRYMNAILISTHLDRADMRNAFLRTTALVDSYLNAAHMENADLSGADLRGAHLHDATLYKAKLNRANLQRAEFNRADVKEADFTDADLTDADFTSVDLSLARGLCREQVVDIVKGRGTIVPRSLPRCESQQKVK